MLRINNFLHREKFSDLTRRWLHNQWRPADLPLLKELINYNSLWLARINREITHWLFSNLAQQNIHTRKVETKGELKDLLVQNPPYVNDRILHLMERYHRYPERYFRETPFLGAVYAFQRDGKPAYLGSSRIKRVRRIAEKGSRRIIDYIHTQLGARANVEAQTAEGSWQQPWSVASEALIDEFERAERKLSAELQHGDLFDSHLEFVIEDVLGIKVVVEPEQRRDVYELIEQDPRCEWVEIEHHRGHYNATNLVIRYIPDREKLLAPPLSPEALERLKLRGMDPATAQQAFHRFVSTGEPSIHIELILTHYEEVLESEIGRSMHEERLLRQRKQQSYRGHLARNVSYLMEYIFAWGISPRTTISQLPIQVWNQYLPDYFDEVIKHLFQIPSFRELE